MGAIQQLPEELLRDVLGYALHVPLAEFLLIAAPPASSPHPIPRRPSPASALLLVCAQWHRIGLPLLFRSLSLSAPAHLPAVAATLTARPRLARAVRAVRLHSAYGPALAPILASATNLSALSIDMACAPGAALGGLRRGVRALAPRVLHVHAPHPARGGWHAARCALDALLEGAVRGWRDLEEVHIYPRTPWLPSSLLGALATLPALRVVSLDLAHVEAAAAARAQAPLDRLAASPALEAIVCRGERGAERIASVRGAYGARFGELARPESVPVAVVEANIGHEGPEEGAATDDPPESIDVGAHPAPSS